MDSFLLVASAILAALAYGCLGPGLNLTEGRGGRGLVGLGGLAHRAGGLEAGAGVG